MGLRDSGAPVGRQLRLFMNYYISPAGDFEPRC